MRTYKMTDAGIAKATRAYEWETLSNFLCQSEQDPELEDEKGLEAYLRLKEKEKEAEEW